MSSFDKTDKTLTVASYKVEAILNLIDKFSVYPPTNMKFNQKTFCHFGDET
jgi:hypothetical protein